MFIVFFQLVFYAINVSSITAMNITFIPTPMNSNQRETARDQNLL